MPSTTNNRLRVIIPIIILIVGVLIAVALKLSHSPPERTAPVIPLPTVEVLKLRTENLRLTVKTQGTVTSDRESSLVAELTGRMVWVSPKMVVGGVFEQGARIAQIDPADYDLAETRAGARVAEAQQHLELVKAEAEQAAIEWQTIGSGEPSALVLRKPQLAEAEARLAAAKADLAQAQLDVSRTDIVAPFRGRILSERVEIGQWVVRGAELGRIYGIDIAEIRLPLSNRDLAKLEPSIQQLVLKPDQQPTVEFNGTIGETQHQWFGKITRTEGTIDLQSRLFYVVAQVTNPLEITADKSPMLKGLFVNATISGKTIDNVFRIPRQALLRDQRVMIVDDNDQLQFRDVHIIQESTDDIIIDRGLTMGDRLVVSKFNAPVAGTPVQVNSAPSHSPQSVPISAGNGPAQ